MTPNVATFLKTGNFMEFFHHVGSLEIESNKRQKKTILKEGLTLVEEPLSLALETILKNRENKSISGNEANEPESPQSLLTALEGACNWNHVLARLTKTIPLEKDPSRFSSETLILIGLYLASNQSSNAGDALDQDVVDLCNSISSHFSPPSISLWETAMVSKNLRIIMPDLGPKSGATALNKLLVALNEELEAIRHRALDLAGFTDIKAVFSDDLLVKQLSSLLSTCFLTALEYNTISNLITHINLKRLAIFASALPITWFTAPFIKILSKSLRSSLSEKDIPALQLIQAHSLISTQVDVEICNLLAQLTLFPDAAPDSKIDAIISLIGYSSNSKHAFTLLCSSLNQADFKVSLKVSRFLGQFLSTTDHFVQPSLALLKNAHVSGQTSQDYLSILKIYYYVTLERCKKEQPPFRWFKSKERAEFLVGLQAAVLDSSKIETQRQLFALLGTIKALQERSRQNLKISTSFLKDLEGAFLEGLSLGSWSLTPFLIGELGHDLSMDEFKHHNLCSVFQNALEDVIDSPVYLALPATSFKEGSDADLLKELELKLNDTEESFSSLGKICKGVASGVKVMFETKQMDTLLYLYQKLNSFCRMVSNECNTALFNLKESKDSSVLYTLAFKYLKAVFFSVLILLEPLSNNLQSSFLYRNGIKRDEYQVMIQLIDLAESSLAHLHFVVVKNGFSSLSLYQKQTDIFAASLVKISIKDPVHSKLAHVAALESQAVQAGNMTNPTDLQEYAKLCFYLECASKMIAFVGSDYIVEKVIPLINKYLLMPVQSDSNIDLIRAKLFETSHSIWLLIFDCSLLHQQEIRLHGINYIKHMISNIHNGIELKFAQESFPKVITGLCDFGPERENRFIFGNEYLFEDEDELYESNNSERRSLTIIPLESQDDWAHEALEIAWESILFVVKSIQEADKTHGVTRETIRVSLCTILFGTISTIGLAKLEDLLQVIEILLLGGSPFGAEKPFHKLVDGDLKLGIVENMKSSLIWKSLYESVSEPLMIDYSRRERCVIWYLDVYKKAKLKFLEQPISASNVVVAARARL